MALFSIHGGLGAGAAQGGRVKSLRESSHKTVAPSCVKIREIATGGIARNHKYMISMLFITRVNECKTLILCGFLNAVAQRLLPLGYCHVSLQKQVKNGDFSMKKYSKINLFCVFRLLLFTWRSPCGYRKAIENDTSNSVAIGNDTSNSIAIENDTSRGKGEKS
ncbi:hypothetical protein [Ruminococcus flavefaciens]|uniref:hypothetical protein n=1 Tax=Ruminococcus flavefaciens TaxID=1265 RepID=UPI0026EB6D89|nr:hypothetical protein [Ruminococcus flavefaciens]